MSAPRITARVLGGVLAVGLVVAGCAQPLPTADPAPAPVLAPPVINATQEAAILGAIGQNLEDASERVDAAKLGDRLSGPALTIRTSELAVATLRKSDETISQVPTEVESVMVPATFTWPRTVLAISVQPELQTQRLLVLEQTSARAPYKLWGWTRLFPGTRLPNFAMSTTGSAQVDPTTDAFKMTPADAIAHYANVLNKGEKSAFINDFGPDPFRAGIEENSRLQNEALKAAKGKQTMKFTPVPGQVSGLQSVDGGALIVGELTGLEVRTAESGALLSPSTPIEKALTKKLKVKNEMAIGYTTTVAIYIPAKGSGEPVAVVGVEHVATSANIPK